MESLNRLISTVMPQSAASSNVISRLATNLDYAHPSGVSEAARNRRLLI
jgi:hypothetical protein